MKRGDVSRLVALAVTVHQQHYGGDKSRRVLMATDLEKPAALKIADLVREDTDYFEPVVHHESDGSWSLYLELYRAS
jgi:hypothetical protein